MSNEKITIENLATFKEYNDKVYATKVDVKNIPTIITSTTDIEEGSALAAGTIYMVYEE